MIEILLMRHGPAEMPGFGSDEERPLTEEGRAVVGSVARGLAELGLRPNRIHASPLVRAQETAQLLAAAWEPHEPPIETTPELAPGGDANSFVEGLWEESGRIAVVGHQPTMSRISSLLLTGDEDGPRIGFDPAAVSWLGLSTNRQPTSLYAHLPPAVFHVARS